MNNLRLSCFLLFYIGTFSSIYGQNFVFDAQKVNVEDGLPHRSANNIAQDLDGFIWISTPGVISKYDGYQFKYYDANFLKINEKNAPSLAVDKYNRIWFCERDNRIQKNINGIINPKNESIITIDKVSNGLFSAQDILNINQSTQNKTDIFITTRQGVIYKYNGQFEKVYKFPSTLNQFAVCDETSNGDYWILNKLDVLKIKNNKLVASYKIPKKRHTLYRIVANTQDLILESRDYLNRASYWTLKHDKLIPFYLKNISNKGIFHLYKITKDFIFCSQDNTLFVLNKFGNILFTYKNQEILGSPFNYQTVFTDKQNILWIGTRNGIVKIIAKKTLFEVYLEKQSIRGIYKDKNNLFISSYTGNTIIDVTTGKLKKEPKIYQVLTSFFKEDDTQVWSGTTTNMTLEFNPTSNEWEKHPIENIIQLFVVFKNTTTQKYWIGTSDGLVSLDPKSNTIAYHISPLIEKQTEIRAITQDSCDIWISSNKGLFLMDAKTEEISNHYSLSTGLPFDNINHLHVDTDHTLWLATKGGGLIHWNRNNNTFKSYTTQNGFSNNTIYAVYPDDYNNLWLPSNNGLIRFNKETNNVRVYLTKDGIAHEEFNTFAHYKDKNGMLYFGGLKGVTAFHPKDLLNENNTKTALKLTGIKVLNENKAEFEPVISQFKSEKQITLKPTDRVLEIEVSLLDFENPSEHQYLYQIKGYQEQWLYTNNNKINFNNLPYGSYTINIKGKRLTSSETSDILEIPVHVKKPFYLTWTFIIAVLGTLTVSLIVFFKWRFRKLEKDQDRLENEVKLRTQQIEKDKQIITAQASALKELDEVKSRFFTNITHEFRTPLTLIKGPLEQIIDNPPPPNIFKRRISGVLKNTNQLLSLINQLLDLSKLENGQMPLQIVHHDIINYTGELINRFQPLARKKEQTLTFITLKSEWTTYFDADKWNKILYNLLSNAIKFTPNNGDIGITLKNIHINNTDSIFLEVKDSGVGIGEDQQKYIFDRFYQADNSSTRQHDGTGIGLALLKEIITRLGGSIQLTSKKNQGATFTIHLPVLEREHSSEIQPNVQSLKKPLTDDVTEETCITNEETYTEIDKLDLLIVEDNQDMREYIMQCLNPSLYNIIQASNGEEGLKKAQAQIPDLIISDVMMPKMNGFEFTKNIRNTLSTSHIPLILLTAKATIESKLEGLTRGADAYLTKPFSPKELELRVEKLIELRSLIQTRYTTDKPLKTSKTYQQEDVFITKLKEFILENIDDSELNGDQIGNHLSISRVHLYRKLKALTNLSITEYIKKNRLETALKLIREGQFNVSEIAYKTGFSSPSIFSKTFKKVYGKSPSQM